MEKRACLEFKGEENNPEYCRRCGWAKMNHAVKDPVKPRVEYRTFSFDDEDQESVLPLLSRDGWEVVSATPMPSADIYVTWYVFAKREVGE